jgi:hypothetical protein
MELAQKNDIQNQSIKNALEAKVQNRNREYLNIKHDGLYIKAKEDFKTGLILFCLPIVFTVALFGLSVPNVKDIISSNWLFALILTVIITSVMVFSGLFIILDAKNMAKDANELTQISKGNFTEIAKENTQGNDTETHTVKIPGPYEDTKNPLKMLGNWILSSTEKVIIDSNQQSSTDI